MLTNVAMKRSNQSVSDNLKEVNWLKYCTHSVFCFISEKPQYRNHVSPHEHGVCEVIEVLLTLDGLVVHIVGRDVSSEEDQIKLLPFHLVKQGFQGTRGHITLAQGT